MAAPMRRSFCLFSRLKLKNGSEVSLNPTRLYSTDDSAENRDKRATHACLSPDKSTVLLWHPEQEFPYEHSRPIPRNRQELAQGDTVLKIQYMKEYEMSIKRPDGPNDVELANMLYETKHRFFPKPQKKYRKVNPPVDREGL